LVPALADPIDRGRSDCGRGPQRQLTTDRYAVSESFAVNRVNQQTSVDYQYDGYYALQAADLFAQTVVSWFATPSVLREVYSNANLDPEITTVNSLPSRFRVKKYSAQNIVVRFSERDETRAKGLATSIRRVMEEKASRLNQTADGKALFEIVGTEPVIAPAKPSVWLWAGVALILSAGLALFIAALRYYLRAS
jgi:hypothetical protein